MEEPRVETLIGAIFLHLHLLAPLSPTSSCSTSSSCLSLLLQVNTRKKHPSRNQLREEYSSLYSTGSSIMSTVVPEHPHRPAHPPLHGNCPCHALQAGARVERGSRAPARAALADRLLCWRWHVTLRQEEGLPPLRHRATGRMLNRLGAAFAEPARLWQHAVWRCVHRLIASPWNTHTCNLHNPTAAQDGFSLCFRRFLFFFFGLLSDFFLTILRVGGVRGLPYDASVVPAR